MLLGIASVSVASGGDDVSMPYGSFSGYFSNDELTQYVESLATREPDIFAAPVSIGTSLEGRDIKAVCAGRCARTPNSVDSAPQVFYNAMIHGREPMSMAALVYFLEYLAGAKARGDLEAMTLLRHRDLWFVLNLNPDAYEYNFVHSPNRCGSQRKNTRDSCPARKTRGGVDLNRNFPVCFDIDDKGSSKNKCQEDYRGEEPFSEPEARALRDFVSGQKFSIALSYHSFGRFINQPYMCKKQQSLTPTVARDLEFFKRFGESCTTNAPGTSHKLWEYGHPWDSYLYTVNGDASDWMYHEMGIFAMAPEVGPECASCKRIRDCDGFWPKKEQISELAQETLLLSLQAARLAGPLLSLKTPPTLKSAGSACQPDAIELLLENIGVRNAKGAVSVALFFSNQQQGQTWKSGSDVDLALYETTTVQLTGASLCDSESASNKNSDVWSVGIHMHDFCTLHRLQISFEKGPDSPELLFDATDSDSTKYFIPCTIGQDGSIVIQPHGRITEAVENTGDVANQGDAFLAQEIEEERDADAISFGTLSYIDLGVWVCVLIVMGGLLKLYCDRRTRYQRLYSTDAARAVVNDAFSDIFRSSGGRHRASAGGSKSAEFSHSSFGALGSPHMPGTTGTGFIHDDPYALSSDEDAYSVASSTTDC